MFNNIKYHSMIQLLFLELRVTSFPSHRRLIKMGDDKMCMKHSDCPKSFPVCMPGPFTQELLSNDQQKEFFFVGMNY